VVHFVLNALVSRSLLHDCNKYEYEHSVSARNRRRSLRRTHAPAAAHNCMEAVDVEYYDDMKTMTDEDGDASSRRNSTAERSKSTLRIHLIKYLPCTVRCSSDVRLYTSVKLIFANFKCLLISQFEPSCCPWVWVEKWVKVYYEQQQHCNDFIHPSGIVWYSRAGLNVQLDTGHFFTISPASIRQTPTPSEHGCTNCPAQQ